jgi:hypothetical protein
MPPKARTIPYYITRVCPVFRFGYLFGVLRTANTWLCSGYIIILVFVIPLFVHYTQIFPNMKLWAALAFVASTAAFPLEKRDTAPKTFIGYRTVAEVRRYF